MGDSDSRQSAFEVVVQHLDGHAELLLIGELDIATAPILLGAIDRLVLDGQRDVRLNLSGLTFLDAAGLGALVAAAQQLAGLGGRLIVAGARGTPLRVLTIFGMAESLTGDNGPAAQKRQQTGTSS